MNMARSVQTAHLDDPLASVFAATYAGLIAFIVVVTEGNFSRAADRLGIGRSAVSRNVKKLEEQLGVRLLSRTTRATSLTREGDLLYSSCHEGVSRIAQALEEMRDLRAGPPRGHLCIHSTVTFGRQIVAPLLAEFQYMYPEISLDLVLSDHPADFTVDRVDVAFLEGRLTDSQIIARTLAPMKMRVCANPEYLNARGIPERLEDLVEHDCINLRLPSGRIQEWELRRGAGISRPLINAKMTFNDPELILQAAIEGHGVVMLPSYLCRQALSSGQLVECLGELTVDDLAHYLCYQSRQHMPSRTRTFIDFMSVQMNRVLAGQNMV
ncbi:LysR family transcriptional regulator [Stenotrophomonas indicatrix]|uniref:LysR family transcriptional regulator n=1 Tax=Stenotrophomonas indicatrix TaxID=2045451 RepID=UPI00215B2514|nr:LysR family transcriptional regulator [Stenotrophomonas indicatrix]MCR8713108.1 LysR family transcriptional regulator [Stenotrophomonas indicatrix]